MLLFGLALIIIVGWVTRCNRYTYTPFLPGYCIVIRTASLPTPGENTETVWFTVLLWLTLIISGYPSVWFAFLCHGSRLPLCPQERFAGARLLQVDSRGAARPLQWPRAFLEGEGDNKKINIALHLVYLVASFLVWVICRFPIYVAEALFLLPFCIFCWRPQYVTMGSMQSDPSGITA